MSTYNHPREYRKVTPPNSKTIDTSIGEATTGDLAAITGCPEVNNGGPSEADILRAQAIWSETRASGKRVLSDDTIKMLLGITNGKNGVTYLLSKTFFDNVPLTKSDIDVAGDPEQLRQMYLQALELIVGQQRSTGQASRLSEQLVEFYDAYSSGGVAKLSFKERSEMLYFNSLILEVNNRAGLGKERHVSVQNGMFIHWTTDARASMLESEKYNYSRRIYLNPQPGMLLPFFKEIMEAVISEGLPTKGKAINRSIELIGSRKSGYSRGDGIVLYANEQTADKLLAIVERVYKAYHQDFEGRACSRIPYSIGDGVAIGDNPIDPNESLTSSRVKNFEDTAKFVRSKINVNTDPEAVELFRKQLVVLCESAGIDPDNFSFYKK